MLIYPGANHELAAVEDVSRRMAAHYGGDPAVCDATHVFWFAEFIHQKGKLHCVRIVSANEFDPPRKLSDFHFSQSSRPRSRQQPDPVSAF